MHVENVVQFDASAAAHVGEGLMRRLVRGGGHLSDQERVLTEEHLAKCSSCSRERMRYELVMDFSL